VPGLQERLGLFDGKILSRPGKMNLRTNEGPAAVQELINYLNSASPLPKMKWNSGLAQAAAFHCSDTGPKGSTGHNSSNGTGMMARV